MTTTKITRGKLSVRKEIIFKKPSCSSALYKRREVTVVKKASELAKLCGIDLCIICYDREGELIWTWPEDKAKVRDMAERYSRLDDKERNKKSTNLSRFLNKKASSLVKENDNKVLEMESSLESRLRIFQEKLRRLLQDQTNVVSTDISSDSSLIVDHQPLMNHPSNLMIPADSTTSCSLSQYESNFSVPAADLSTSSSLNQQHPNNFSVPADLSTSNFSILLYNHDDGTFTQLTNSAPPSFEQPVIPYYNQDCGTTSSYLDLLLGEEDMRSCNNFDLPPSFEFPTMIIS